MFLTPLHGLFKALIFAFQKILDKYSKVLNEKRILPSKTNAHFNSYLKEIAGLCEIKINLTPYNYMVPSNISFSNFKIS
jgi:hypothetical protein